MFFIRKNKENSLKLVKAGEAGKVVPLYENVEGNFWNSPVFANYDDYYHKKDNKDVFMVAGESMAQGFVHTGDLLFCSLAENVVRLDPYKLIVLKVNSNRLKCKNEINFGFKLRKYIMTIDMNNSLEFNLNNLKQVDDMAKYSVENQDSFKDKYQKAYNEIIAKENVLVSVTYTNRGREYSFHEQQDLHAIVDCVFSKTDVGYVLNDKI